MRGNSGIIGPLSDASIDSAGGSHVTFEQYSSRLVDEWPRLVIANITPAATTIYRGPAYTNISWQLENIPADQTPKWRVIGISNYDNATGVNTSSGYITGGVTQNLSGTSGTISLRALISGSAATTLAEDTTFRIQLVGQRSNGTVVVYATSDLITIAGIQRTIVAGKMLGTANTELVTTLDEGATFSMTWTLSPVQPNIPFYWYIENNSYAKLNRTNGAYFGVGSHNAGTRTTTIVATFSVTKDYTSNSDYNIAYIAISPHTSTGNTELLYLVNSVTGGTVVKTTSPPTLSSPSSGATVNEYASTLYRVNFGESPVGTFSYTLEAASGGTDNTKWIGGHTGTLSNTSTFAQVYKTYSDDNDTQNRQFRLRVANQWGTVILLTPYFTMANKTPILDSVSLLREFPDAGPDQYVSVGGGLIPNPTEDGNTLKYKVQINGNSKDTHPTIKDFTWTLSASTGSTFSSDDVTLVSGGITATSNFSDADQEFFYFVADELEEGIEAFDLKAFWNGIQKAQTTYYLQDTSRPPPPPNDFDIETAEFNNISAANTNHSVRMWNGDQNVHNVKIIYAGQTTYAGADVMKFYVNSSNYDSNDIYTFYYDLSTSVLYDTNIQTDWQYTYNKIFNFNRHGTHYVVFNTDFLELQVYECNTPWTIDIYSDQAATQQAQKAWNALRNTFGGSINQSTYDTIHFSDDESKIILSNYDNGAANFWTFSIDGSYNLTDSYQSSRNADASYGLASGRFEFNRDGTEVTLYHVPDQIFTGSPEGKLGKFILSTPWDMSSISNINQPAATLNIIPPSSALSSYQTSYGTNQDWFIHEFFFDRTTEDKLYLFGSLSNYYQYVWDYDISTLRRLDTVPAYDITTATIVDYDRNDGPYLSPRFMPMLGYYGAKSNGLQSLQQANLTSNKTIALIHNDFGSQNFGNGTDYLEFSPNYSRGDINANFSSEPNQYYHFWHGPLDVVDGGAPTTGGYLIFYKQENNNPLIFFANGNDTFFFNGFPGFESFQPQNGYGNTREPQTASTAGEPTGFYAQVDTSTSTGFMIFSYDRGNYTGPRFARVNFEWSGYYGSVGGWFNFSTAWTFDRSIQFGQYLSKYGKFQFNKDGTRVTLIGAPRFENNNSVNSLETFDLSSSPYNINLIVQPGTNAAVKVKDFGSELLAIEQQNGPAFSPEIYNFLFQKAAPRQQLYLITSSISGTSYMNRYTYEMEQEYLNNILNSWGSGADTLNPIDVVYDAANTTIVITFLDEAEATQFETFMTTFLTISTGYQFEVQYQGRLWRATIGTASGRSVSRSGADLTIDFVSGVSNVTEGEAEYNWNTIEITIESVANGNASTSTNTISVVLASGDAAIISTAFSNSSCGAGAVEWVDGSNRYFNDNSNDLLAAVGVSNDTIGFAFDANLSQQSFNTGGTTWLKFTVDKEITGTGSLNIVEPVVLTQIVPTGVFTNGSNYIDFQFADSKTADKARALFQNLSSFGMNLPFTIYTGDGFRYRITTQFYDPSFMSQTSINTYSSTTWGLSGSFNQLQESYDPFYAMRNQIEIFISPYNSNSTNGFPYPMWDANGTTNFGDGPEPYTFSLVDSRSYTFWWSKHFKEIKEMLAVNNNAYAHTGLSSPTISYPQVSWTADTSYEGFFGGQYITVLGFQYDPNLFDLPFEPFRYYQIDNGACCGQSTQLFIQFFTEADRTGFIQWLTNNQNIQFYLDGFNQWNFNNNWFVRGVYDGANISTFDISSSEWTLSTSMRVFDQNSWGNRQYDNGLINYF